MWAWLNGPGRVFREPKEGSTNYLGAYDKSGRLIRERDSTENEKDGDGTATKNASESEKETTEDLRPFPLNPYFRSQPVLSEELKDKIYKSVAVEGKSIREVSQYLHVEMRRIAAVVRLKTIELEWTKQVRLFLVALLRTHPYLQTFQMMRQPKNRLVLKTIYMVTKYSMRASLISFHFPLPLSPQLPCRPPSDASRRY